MDRSTEAHDKYEFSEAGRILYDFFWSDFADWYIEASKARMYSTDIDTKRTTQAVLVYVVERTLRLWHPFMPYITEELWQAVPHQGEALITAPWPSTQLPRWVYFFAADSDLAFKFTEQYKTLRSYIVYRRTSDYCIAVGGKPECLQGHQGLWTIRLRSKRKFERALEFL